MARILLIDDDDVVRTVLCALLVRSGHTVIEARDGEEGLDLFPRIVPDLVITDIVMPKKSGLEVMQALREKKPCVKIIVMSGGDRNGPGDNLQAATLIGATSVLAKPFAVAELLAEVNEVLAG
jgi:two-component system response regulator (stage 0 sporulation protein F)